PLLRVARRGRAVRRALRRLAVARLRARGPVRLLAVRLPVRGLLRVGARRGARRRCGVPGGRVALRRVGLLLVRVLGQGGSSGGAPRRRGRDVGRVLASPATSAMIGARAGSPRILPEAPGRTPPAPRGCSSMVELQLPKLTA